MGQWGGGGGGRVSVCVCVCVSVCEKYTFLERSVRKILKSMPYICICMLQVKGYGYRSKICHHTCVSGKNATTSLGGIAPYLVRGIIRSIKSDLLDRFFVCTSCKDISG